MESACVLSAQQVKEPNPSSQVLAETEFQTYCLGTATSPLTWPWRTPGKVFLALLPSE